MTHHHHHHHHHHPSPSPSPSPPPLPIIFSLLISLLPHLTALPVLPDPDPSIIQQQQQQPFHLTPSPLATIPSLPEQSAVAGCPLILPDELFPAVRASCGGGGQIRRGRCCPVLATLLYSAYSDTSLGRATKKAAPKVAETTSSSYDMPLLPDDSETCVDGLEKAMREKGVDLVRPNATCDVVYCFCGIRFYSLSCPQAFSVSEDGSLVGGERIKSLEIDCFSANGTGNHCSKCLKSLYTLKKGETGRANTTKSDGRTSKMRSRECELMGLTWLLNKNRDAYISTVTAVMRALMMNTEGSDPLSCSLGGDGMPLAVDSVEINGQSSSVALCSLSVYLMSLFLLIISSPVLPYCF